MKNYVLNLDSFCRETPQKLDSRYPKIAFRKKKYYFLFLSIFTFTRVVYSEIPFSISNVPEPTASGSRPLDQPVTIASLVSQLKQRAIKEWLQGQLGERFPEFEKFITSDFSERYILDYKIGRSGPKREILELTGHLDSESLKKWIRLQDTRKGNSSLKPLLFFSSSVSNFSFPASETNEKIHGTSLGQTFRTLMNPLFQKLNAQPTFPTPSAPVSLPAKSDLELAALWDYSNQVGANAIVWIHLQPCNSCEGKIRVDLFFYSIPGRRMSLTESSDLIAKFEEWNNRELLKNLLSPLISQFQTGLETLISSGVFQSERRRVVLEGVESYRSYKSFETELSRSDYASSVYTKKVGPRYAEFEILTSFSAEELALRIENSGSIPRVKAQKFDPQTVIVRYSK